jgi:FkbM family methyltransferase
MKHFVWKLITFLKKLPDRRHPIRLLIAFLLQKSGISRFMVINRDNYQIWFHPTSHIARVIWIDPQARRADERILSFLRAGDTIVDIGANIGTVSLAAASIVGKLGKVLAIEPHPETFQNLESNIRLNKYTNITTFQYAVGRENKIICFSNLSSDDQNFVVSDGVIEVKQVTLDSLIEEQSIKHVDMLKIDTEGYEKEILLGAQKMLNKVDCIYIETRETNLVHFSTSVRELIQLLRDAGYYMCRLDGDNHNTIAIRRNSTIAARRDWNSLIKIDLEAI